MKGQLPRRGRVWQRASQLAAASLVTAALGAMSGCLTRPLQPEDTRTTSTVVARLVESAVDKIDLLLMVDNSRSMADKQAVLVAAVPDLVRGLVNPKCVDAKGVPTMSQPAGPTDACPDPTSKRDFNPVLDIHIGIVTSSLGGHGSDSCPDIDKLSCPGGTNTTNNDHGHLVSRVDQCAGGAVPTYLGKSFLAWDPSTPPKHMADPNPAVHTAALGAITYDVNTGTSTVTTPGLIPDLKDMVLGTGQIGCGYESQLEGWYRFLVDPDPPQSITLDAKAHVKRVGLDNVLLQQRKDFLRSSSLLAIIVITDENDASIKEYDQFWIIGQQRDPNNPNKNFYMPKARHECATNPNDKCCRSCAQDQTGCPADSNCPGNYDSKTDDVNLREWHQKQRFGIDFYYPVQRYVDGLTLPTVLNSAGQPAPNPIFSVLDTSSGDTNVRDASLVFYAGILGVPWQDIARDPKDLTKGFKTAAELAKKDPQGHTTWDYIIGDPDNFVPPLDPHMVEDNKPRTGTNPITGTVLAPTTAPAGADAINGHEYTPGTKMGVQSVADDIEYACIFDLPQARDCSDPNVAACDCADPKNDNPLCDADPSKGGNRTLQKRAKAYPGIRELQVAQKMAAQGIVGSICPAQLTDLSRPDFGYRPTIGAIIDRLKLALGGQCLPRQLKPNKEAQVSCLILEGRNTNNTHKADCDAFCDGKTAEKIVARQHVQADHKPAIESDDVQKAIKQSNLDCFCEIQQLTGPTTKTGCTNATTPLSALDACQCQTADPPIFSGMPANGWCYVDATSNPTVGNPDIVKNCQSTEKHLVRFAGGGNPAPGATLFITCAGD